MLEREIVVIGNRRTDFVSGRIKAQRIEGHERVGQILLQGVILLVCCRRLLVIFAGARSDHRLRAERPGSTDARLEDVVRKRLARRRCSAAAATYCDPAAEQGEVTGIEEPSASSVLSYSVKFCVSKHVSLLNASNQNARAAPPVVLDADVLILIQPQSGIDEQIRVRAPLVADREPAESSV